jgi:GNAT superfamily N-acetyltransferase
MESRLQLPGARPADPEDHEAASEALALAFADDPAWRHLLPDDASRAERLLAFFAAEIAHHVPRYREVWVTEDGFGAAVWARPGRWEVPLLHTLRQGPLMRKIFGRRLPLATWTLLRIERRHPRTPEHWYLQYIGVEPRRQGRGLGAALLTPILEQCDRDGTPAHLEASSDRNRALYERNGFSLTETFHMPAGGPPLRKMWRGSRPATDSA